MSPYRPSSPALPCQLTHRCPAGVERRVAVPAGMSRRVRGPLLEIWGELSTGRGALLLLQNQRQEAVAGNRETHGHWQAISVLYDLASPTWTHAVTPGRVHSSLLIHVVLTHLEEQNFLQKYLGRKPDKESVLPKKQIFCVEGGTRVCLGHTSAAAPRDLPSHVRLCLPTEAHVRSPAHSHVSLQKWPQHLQSLTHPPAR